tara:strand:- start:88 stop:1251 length:1164 start_codon:yes stop_codon:yes gene_type:complete
MYSKENLENGHGDFTALLSTLQDQASRKIDFVADTVGLDFQTRGGATTVHAEQTGMATIATRCNDTAFGQVLAKADIDTRTGRRLQENYPDVLDLALNRIYSSESKSVMLRTFDSPADSNEPGELRAFLSDKYKRFDNLDMLSAVVPPLMESDARWQIVNSTVTEKAMTLRLKSESITGRGATVGDLMALGMTLGNSETGHSSAVIAMLIWTLICLNGMQTSKKERSAHLTSSQSDSAVWSVLSSEAKEADNAALSMKLRDVAANYSSTEAFEEVLQSFRDAANDTLSDGTTPQAAVEQVGRVLQLTKKETASVLDGLFSTMGQRGYAGQPVSRAALVNAVTNVGNDARLRADEVQADDVGEWEKRGGRLLDLPKNQWTSIATARAA